ncbi:MAG: hypothetical protein ACE149_04980 [Armatimonadota bacterium]
MSPQERLKLYAKIVAAGGIIVWGLLCFLIAVSPRLSRLHRVQGDLAKANTQLQEMRKEIENAAIIGQPGPGESRYEKFGILGADEEQLFLSDLIDFCKETNNTLNVVRRADVARSAVETPEGTPQKTGPTGEPVAPTPAPQPGAPAGESAGPQPIIEKVPHTVNYTGTFLSSFYLLRRLESYKRLLTVERVEIGADTRVGYPRVNGNITIDLYLVKNPGQAPAGAGPAQSAPAGEAAGGGEAAASGDVSQEGRS